MSVQKITIPVPASGQGVSASSASLTGQKTVILTGRFNGYYDLFGSQDDVNYVGLASFSSGGIESIRQTVPGAFKSLRILSNAVPLAGPVTCEVSGVVGQNYFTTLATIAPGTSGPGSVVDTWALFPPTGVEQDMCFLCTGGFRGSIVVMGSLDGTRWNAVGSFTADRLPEGSPDRLTFPAIVSPDKVRYLQVLVNGTVTSTVAVTFGGSVPSSAGPVTGENVSILTDQTTGKNYYVSGSRSTDSPMADANGNSVSTTNNAVTCHGQRNTVGPFREAYPGAVHPIVVVGTANTVTGTSLAPTSDVGDVFIVGDLNSVGIDPQFDNIFGDHNTVGAQTIFSSLQGSYIQVGAGCASCLVRGIGTRVLDGVSNAVVDGYGQRVGDNSSSVFVIGKSQQLENNVAKCVSLGDSNYVEHHADTVEVVGHSNTVRAFVTESAVLGSDCTLNTGANRTVASGFHITVSSGSIGVYAAYCVASGSQIQVGSLSQETVAIGHSITVGEQTGDVYALGNQLTVADGCTGIVVVGLNTQVGTAPVSDVCVVGRSNDLSLCVGLTNVLGSYNTFGANSQGHVLGNYCTFQSAPGVNTYGIAIGTDVTILSTGQIYAIGIGDQVEAGPGQCIIGDSDNTVDPKPQIHYFAVRGYNGADLDTIRAVDSPADGETGLTVVYNTAGTFANKTLKASASPPVGALYAYVDP